MHFYILGAPSTVLKCITSFVEVNTVYNVTISTELCTETGNQNLLSLNFCEYLGFLILNGEKLKSQHIHL